uniref:Uncharacterized protein n=1 Tax=Rhizophora mucronata TaxID=61149 RepID=A0A2P2PB33_RHIMU
MGSFVVFCPCSGSYPLRRVICNAC